MIKAEGEIFNVEATSKINSNFLETFEFDSANQYIKQYLGPQVGRLYLFCRIDPVVFTGSCHAFETKLYLVWD